eukprot:2324824-Rhodomonas_salina.3
MAYGGSFLYDQLFIKEAGVTTPTFWHQVAAYALACYAMRDIGHVARYAMSGTDIIHDGTRCAVLTRHIMLPGSGVLEGVRQAGLLSAYGLAMRCPVLTQRMHLPSDYVVPEDGLVAYPLWSYAFPAICPVLSYAMLLPGLYSRISRMASPQPP